MYVHHALRCTYTDLKGRAMTDTTMADRMRSWVRELSDEPTYAEAARHLSDEHVAAIVGELFQGGVPGFRDREEGRSEHIRQMAEFSLRHGG